MTFAQIWNSYDKTLRVEFQKQFEKRIREEEVCLRALYRYCRYGIIATVDGCITDEDVLMMERSPGGQGSQTFLAILWSEDCHGPKALGMIFYCMLCEHFGDLS